MKRLYLQEARSPITLKDRMPKAEEPECPSRQYLPFTMISTQSHWGEGGARGSRAKCEVPRLSRVGGTGHVPVKNVSAFV